GLIAERVIDLSGRQDLKLQDSAGTEKIDHFINAAQLYLDLKIDHYKNHMTTLVALTAGTAVTTVRYLRSIDAVWLSDGTAEYDLEQVDRRSMRAAYPKPIASVDRGRPLYYAQEVIGLAPEQKDVSDLSSYSGVESLMT